MSEFKICNFSLSDVGALAKLEEECFSVPWSKNSILSQLNEPNSICFVAKGVSLGPFLPEMIGYVGAYCVLDECYLANLAVREKWRNRGVGRVLLKRMLQEATLRNLAFVTLEVRKSNILAIRLYKACGFEEVGARKDFYSWPQEDAILMTRFLKG